jgi:Glycosyltransferase family 9 (heptosyltransferase)
MGVGDDIMATGMARGAKARGERFAFGDGIRIRWGPHSREVFRGNPNVAWPGEERASDIRWCNYYKGHRIYNHQSVGRWIWNYDFKAPPGEFFFDDLEKQFAIRRPGAVLIEPNVPWHKSVAVNKDWGVARWQLLSDKMRIAGIRVCQTSYGKMRLAGVEFLPTQTFRQAAAALSGFDLAIVPEGGLHHAAAAVGTPAIVIFGGFIPPQVTGYADHVNLTGGADACGSWSRCQHCRQALDAITVWEVFDHARKLLDQAATAPRRIAGIR